MYNVTTIGGEILNLDGSFQTRTAANKFASEVQSDNDIDVKIVEVLEAPLYKVVGRAGKVSFGSHLTYSEATAKAEEVRVKCPDCPNVEVVEMVFEFSPPPKPDPYAHMRNGAGYLSNNPGDWARYAQQRSDTNNLHRNQTVGDD